MNRRRFLTAASAAAGAVYGSGEKPALLGGKPVRTERFPTWPKFGAQA